MLVVRVKLAVAGVTVQSIFLGSLHCVVSRHGVEPSAWWRLITLGAVILTSTATTKQSLSRTLPARLLQSVNLRRQHRQCSSLGLGWLGLGPLVWRGMISIVESGTVARTVSSSAVLVTILETIFTVSSV